MEGAQSGSVSKSWSHNQPIMVQFLAEPLSKEDFGVSFTHISLRCTCNYKIAKSITTAENVTKYSKRMIFWQKRSITSKHHGKICVLVDSLSTFRPCKKHSCCTHLSQVALQLSNLLLVLDHLRLGRSNAVIWFLESALQVGHAWSAEGDLARLLLRRLL